jgi:hypothetical protein
VAEITRQSSKTELIVEMTRLEGRIVAYVEALLYVVELLPKDEARVVLKMIERAKMDQPAARA